MMEIANGRPTVYDSAHGIELRGVYPLGRSSDVKPCRSENPASHVERSWGSGTAAQPGSRAGFRSRVYLGSRRMPWLGLLVVLLVGCGGSESANPTTQVREAVAQASEDARAGRWGDYCASTTDPEACGQEIAGALALGIDLSVLVPSKDVEERARIKVEGDRATVDATAAEDASYVRRDGRWLYVWESESE